MAAQAVKDVGIQSNMAVDYVLSYRFASMGSFSFMEQIVDPILTACEQIELLPKPISRS
jgi:hypothetical protein